MAFCGYSQELLFREFKMNDQLPSAETYSIRQDSKGFLWIATEEGLCRYSNGQLTVFDKKNGLPEKAVYGSCVDNNGSLWFITKDKRIVYEKNNRIVEARFSKAYQALSAKMFPTAFSVPYSLLFDEQGNLFVSEEAQAFKIVPSTGRIEKISNKYLTFIRKKNKRLIPVQGSGLSPRDNVFLQEEGHSPSFWLKGTEIHVNMGTYYYQTAQTPDYDFISFNENLMRVDQSGKYTFYKTPNRILFACTDKNNGLWIGLYKGGLRYYPDPHNMNRSFHCMGSFSVSGISEDKENGIWCTTLEKGVFHCINKSIIGYTNVPGLNADGTLLFNSHDKLFFSSAGNKLFVLLNNGKIQSFPLNASTDQIVSGAVDCKDHVLIHQTGSTLLYKNGKLISYPPPTGNFWRATFIGEYVYGINNRHLFRMKELNDRKVLFSCAKVMRVLVPLNDHELLIGGREMIMLYDLRSNKIKGLKDIPHTITDIIRTRSGNILASTRSDGLYFVDVRSLSLKKVKAKLPTDILYRMTEDNAGRVWIATNEGLLKLTPEGKDYLPTLYTVQHGLSSNQVNQLVFYNNRLYYSTFEGLFYFPIHQELSSAFVPSPYLRKTKLNGKELNWQQGQKYTYNRNNFSFLFDNTSFRDGNTLIYKLKSNGEYTVNTINGNEVLLNNLSPGEYSLEVRIKNGDGFVSKAPWKTTFIVTPPFWQTIWFQVLFFIFVIALIVFFALLIIKRIKRREEFKTQTNQLLAEYQMSALQAQMNPHFIFNAINTIQGYIISQDKDEAYNYLTQFSKLIRMVLDHSQKKNVPLHEELEILELYIQLEQLRFDHCFDYIEDIGPEVDIYEGCVPSMVIQPFIENAIWHGIVNLKKSRQGKLLLKLRQENDQLLVTIEDNGVGREQAANYRTKAYKSVGLSVTQTRIETLNRLYENQQTALIFTDLYDENGNPAGTRIEMQLPLIFSS